jgi:hypothetical protein
VVIAALEQAIGKERMKWETTAVPDKPYVELRVTYDPTVVDGRAIVAATKAAMDVNPDPGHPGPVRVVLRGPQGEP